MALFDIYYGMNSAEFCDSAGQESFVSFSFVVAVGGVGAVDVAAAGF